jgi:hypothetical protein
MAQLLLSFLVFRFSPPVSPPKPKTNPSAAHAVASRMLSTITPTNASRILGRSAEEERALVERGKDAC